MRNVSWLRLKQEQEVPVLLGLVVVGEASLLELGRVFEVAGNFILLQWVSDGILCASTRRRTSSSAMRFWISNAMRESRYLTSFSSTKFFLDCDEILDLRSRRIFCATGTVSIHHHQRRGECRTFGEVIFDLQVGLVG